MKYIIGMDAGGTTTGCDAYSLEGKKIYSGSGDYGSFVYKQGLENIIKTLNECTGSLKEHQCIYIVIGIAGIGTLKEADKTETEASLSKRFRCQVMLVDDAVIALHSIMENRMNEAILALSGTGSICLGYKDGVMQSTGGWGHILGDEGSGYHTVLRVFKRMVQDEDAGRPQSVLANHLLEALGYKEVNEIKKFIYQNPKKEIAKLMKIIVEESTKNNKEAITLLVEAGCSIANSVICLYNKLGMNDDVTIGVAGSVLVKNETVRKSFKQTILEAIQNANFLDRSIESTKGAYYLAIKQLEGE